LPQTAWRKLTDIGVKKVIYYDLGEVGDYAGFFNTNGAMSYNGWTLPGWKGGEPLTARWFGLEAFMQNVSWSPFPAAQSYNLPPFTTPDGQPATNLYSVLTRRGLDGKWQFEYSSNPKITDDLAQRSGLAAISGKQTSKADVQLGSGWKTVRLVSVDFANPQLRDYVCRDITNLIAKIRPDGVHADNFGDANIGYAQHGTFGLWSQATFREFMQRHFTPPELAQMGIANLATFDIAEYIRTKPFESRGKPWHNLNPKWTTDPVWLCYLINEVETAQAYHRAFYAAAKGAVRTANIDCAIFGNTIPLSLAGSLMEGACDIAHFEWSTVHGWWGMRPMGLPPKGRIGYVARLGAAISDAGYCWPSLYVEKNKSGAGHENLHKVLAFDGLANHALLDYGYWYLDGYSPGTDESAGFVNRFIRTNALQLSGRKFLADVAVVHSAWSEIASHNIANPIGEMFVDEYSGWCQFLGDTHRQWDVLPQSDLTAENLAHFPVVVLPSVLSLTDAQIGELRRYVAGGGRLVATGLTGTRFGPEKFLAVREEKFSLPGARIVTDKPAVDYWRKDGNAAAAKRMAELLDWPGFAPRVETDAPETVGVNLNVGADKMNPLLMLDLNNCDLVAETDKLRAAPACTVKIHLPTDWRKKNLRISYTTPEMNVAGPMEFSADKFAVDAATGTLRISVPSFSTFLLVYVHQVR